jgi:RNA 3'-terminal phosphate cyclase (ATP)
MMFPDDPSTFPECDVESYGMLTIDGSFGEGGGQIVRSSLSLSLVTGQPFTITNVRARRAKPGLRRQHLTAVRAAAAISAAEVTGDALGSSCLSFKPRAVTAGEYNFDVGTAGSTTLVLQTVLPAFLLAEQPSTLTFEGGTHNPFAPPYEFLARTYLPQINHLGPLASVALERHGFYPAGGGRIRLQVSPSAQLHSMHLLERGQVIDRRVRALVANLPLHIAERECVTIANLSGWEAGCFEVEQIDEAHGPGNVVLVEVQCEHITEVFVAFGRRGVRAERVAEEAWLEAERYLSCDVAVGFHLADQLILPLGIAAAAGNPSSFRTLPLSDHAVTHLKVLRCFLNVTTEVEQLSDDECVVRISS